MEESRSRTGGSAVGVGEIEGDLVLAVVDRDVVFLVGPSLGVEDAVIVVDPRGGSPGVPEAHIGGRHLQAGIASIAVGQRADGEEFVFRRQQASPGGLVAQPDDPVAGYLGADHLRRGILGGAAGQQRAAAVDVELSPAVAPELSGAVDGLGDGVVGAGIPLRGVDEHIVDIGVMGAAAGAAGEADGRHGTENRNEVGLADDLGSEVVALSGYAREGDGDMPRVVLDLDVYPGGIEKVRPAGSSKFYRPEVRVVLHVVDLGDDSR